MTLAEPLAYEEEEEELNASIDSPVKADAAVEGSLLGEKRKNQPASSAGAAEGGGGALGGVEPKRRKKVGGSTSRFVEMEAELSDEEGQGADVSEDEDEPDVEEDGMLVSNTKDKDRF